MLKYIFRELAVDIKGLHIYCKISVIYKETNINSELF